LISSSLAPFALSLAFPLIGVSTQGNDPLQLGRQAFFEGRLDEAQSRFEDALAQGVPRVFEVYFSLGRVYLQKRDFTAAKEAFDHSLARAPRFGPALVGRARASLFLGEIEAALGDLKSAQAVPDPPAEAQVLERQLSFYQSRGEPAPEEELLRVLGQELGNADAYLALGVRYRMRAEKDKAVQSLRVAQAIDDENPVSYLLLRELQADPSLPEPYPELGYEFQVARAAVANNDEVAAMSRARTILAKRPRFVPARLLLIHVAESRGDSLETLLSYKDLADLLPEVPALVTEIARIAERAGAYGLAECAARRALAAAPPDRPGAYLLLANAQLSGEKADRAIETCERAIDEGLGTAPIYFTLGEARHQRMELSESIAAFEKAVELDPKAAESIAAFALSSLTTEQYASLRKLLSTYVQSHKESINTLYSLGVMYARDGATREALDYFLRANALAPGQAQIQYNLALVYRQEGMLDEARAAMDRFRALKEDEDKAWLEGRRIDDERLRGREALGAKDFGKAIEIFGELAAAPRHEASDFVGLGEGLVGTGRPDDAREAFQKALGEAPHLVEALAGLARALDVLGEKEEAERYRTAAELLGSSCP
jgi:tetratricopeptide (TPR) repeat protein